MLKWTLRIGLQLLLVCLAFSLLITLPLKWMNPIFWSWQLQREFSPPPAYPEQSAYHWRNLSEISAPMQLAVIAAEDQKFSQHRGIDTESMQQALADIRSGKRFRGASTISQQTVKNLYLWASPSYVRKALEIWLTLWIEQLWSKTRILEIYLNIVEFGPGVYGVEAASQHFFNQPASKLTQRQAAQLASVLPNPYKFDVANPSAYQHQRVQWIERQMRQLSMNYLTQLTPAAKP
ncbi:monofunctional biosynthetic peptidoglycan transglycosylase [Motilimonas pumila]|uniref:Biosynthetic peptidoglycan transglycosylase n=1 Tax=Motilimonas pumila TaxID=2303987 RepID=A0A418YKH2_9GAMM|nr:monofunctional biosynthetic peptidoglycan transglycosylase [Motilimonas pumila]RJG51484.1 monofunctional biosynthetic peptidoglycan transglycosylase [Motilimonas pumila]